VPKRLPIADARLRLVFEPQDWPIAIGVASRLKRLGYQFCVDSDWGFIAGSANVCRADMGDLYFLKFGQANFPNDASCQFIFYDVNEQVKLCSAREAPVNGHN
jgi:hypothetical protein